MKKTELITEYKELVKDNQLIGTINKTVQDILNLADNKNMFEKARDILNKHDLFYLSDAQELVNDKAKEIIEKQSPLEGTYLTFEKYLIDILMKLENSSSVYVYINLTNIYPEMRDPKENELIDVINELEQLSNKVA